MTTTKKSVTRATVIAKALAMDVWTAEEREVLEKMHASITKPRVKPEGPTKGQLENINLAKALETAMREYGEPVTTKWITEHVNGIMTSQKAVAVCKVANVVRFYEGRQCYYRLAE